MTENGADFFYIAVLDVYGKHFSVQHQNLAMVLKGMEPHLILSETNFPNAEPAWEKQLKVYLAKEVDLNQLPKPYPLKVDENA